MQGRKTAAGFTLLEILAALTIMVMVVAVSMPQTQRLYQSIQYHQAVRDLLVTLADARQRAVDTGRAQDVEIDPSEGRIAYNDSVQELPEGFELGVTSASEVNRNGTGVIRFYPEGGSTGGDIDIRSPGGRELRITVDWLMGGVTQAANE